MARVIFTADDFGVNDGIDNGVIKAINNGHINSVAAFANHPNSLDKIARLDNLTNSADYELGCHLTLTSGKPLTNGVDWLLTKRGFFRKYTQHRFPRQGMTAKQKIAIELELKAQIKKLKEYGLPVVHLSSHHNVLFWFKEYADIFMRVAHDTGIAMRTPIVIPRMDYRTYLFTVALRIKPNIGIRLAGSIKRFNREMDAYLNGIDPSKKPKFPDFADSTAYGPILPAENLPAISANASEKAIEVNKYLQTIADYNYEVEIMFHLLDESFLQLDEHKRNMKRKFSNYSGINARYFASRMAEFLALNKIKLPEGVKKGKWTELKP